MHGLSLRPVSTVSGSVSSLSPPLPPLSPDNSSYKPTKKESKQEYGTDSYNRPGRGAIGPSRAGWPGASIHKYWQSKSNNKRHEPPILKRHREYSNHYLSLFFIETFTWMKLSFFTRFFFTKFLVWTQIKHRILHVHLNRLLAAIGETVNQLAIQKPIHKVWDTFDHNWKDLKACKHQLEQKMKRKKLKTNSSIFWMRAGMAKCCECWERDVCQIVSTNKTVIAWELVFDVVMVACHRCHQVQLVVVRYVIVDVPMIDVKCAICEWVQIKIKIILLPFALRVNLL